MLGHEAQKEVLPTMLPKSKMHTHQHETRHSSPADSGSASTSLSGQWSINIRTRHLGSQNAVNKLATSNSDLGNNR